MKRLMIAISASAAIAAAGLVFGASAQEAEPEEQAREEPTEASQDRDKASERFCIQQTGSRIVANRNAKSQSERAECVSSGGRVYTREEIRRTGSTDLADALRRLDPSIF